jgi:hypothetical protein
VVANTGDAPTLLELGSPVSNVSLQALLFPVLRWNPPTTVCEKSGDFGQTLCRDVSSLPTTRSLRQWLKEEGGGVGGQRFGFEEKEVALSH